MMNLSNLDFIIILFFSPLIATIHKMKHFWNRLSYLFSSDTASDRRLSTNSNKSSESSISFDSNLTMSTGSASTGSSSNTNRVPRNRNKLHLRQSIDDRSSMKIPPFSPTYCKDNEFPYSNFYVKLPDGRWMLKYRSGKRDSLGTDTFEGYMI